MSDPDTPPDARPDATAQAGGRRAATRPRRRIGLATVLAVLVPLATVAAAFGLTTQAPRPAADVAPARVALAEQTLVCPPPDDAPAPVAVGRAPGTGEGPVTVTAIGADAGDEAGQTVEPPDGGVVDGVTLPEVPGAVQGAGPAAPGLVAGRFAAETTAGAPCLPPAADQWFSGLGAGAERASVIELVNPETGPAVADVSLLGPDGPLDEPDVEGVTVPAGERISLDLAQISPTEDELVARVEVVRGRLGVSVLDRITPIGGSEEPVTSEWLPAQPTPARSLVLPGLPGGEGGRSLVVANPGTADTQVAVRVATPGGPVAPVGVRELQVPAGGVGVLALGPELAAQVDDGAGAVLVEAASPVTATLRSVVRDDLTLTGAAAPATATTGAFPDGDARVVLAAPPDGDPAPDGATVELTARDADGTVVGTEQVDVAPGAVAQIDLPGSAALVTTDADAPVTAAVAVRRGDGVVVLPLTTPVTDGLVPGVRPGLP